MVSSIHFLHYIVSAYLRQVKFAFCCDFLYFRSANIYSPKKGARCCNKSLTSSVLSFVVMYKRGVVMFGVVSLTMGNSAFLSRWGASRRHSCCQQHKKQCCSPLCRLRKFHSFHPPKWFHNLRNIVLIILLFHRSMFHNRFLSSCLAVFGCMLVW